MHLIIILMLSDMTVHYRTVTQVISEVFGETDSSQQPHD